MHHRRDKIVQKQRELQKLKAKNRGLTPRQIAQITDDKKPTRKIINDKKRIKPARPATIVRGPLPSLPIAVTIQQDIPSWFVSPAKVDVSIIVPMFKSDVVIQDQIKSWVFDDDGLTKEVIYVDDQCPGNSAAVVINSWTQRKQKDNSINSIGKVIKNKNNLGFSGACNTGAAAATGKYLIFLNADCNVSKNWIKPMIELLENDPTIGLVGNMQTRDGHIDSAGSEWCWEYKHFAHVGKSIHKGKKIQKIPLNKIPADLLVPQEREMVTGCCFAIRKELFDDIQGFDTNYRVGYWEDADICLRVRANGYKIFFQPASRITHVCGHSKSGGHPYRENNKSLFFNRWVHTGRIDSMIANQRANPGDGNIKNTIKTKVTGCVIACNEEEFLEASVKSAAPMVDEWIFVIGGNRYANQAGMCDQKGYPTDNTLDIARSLVKKYGGEVIEPPGRCWHDKVEMRNAYARKLPAETWMFMLDGDEVYKPNQLWRLAELMKEHDCLIMQFWLFWNNINTIGTGVWDNYSQERVVKWKKGYEYAGKNHLHVSYQSKNVCSQVKTWRNQQERLFYHYSWVRPLEKIKQKIEYYRHQTGKYKPNYVADFFLKWRENPELVHNNTHPFGGGGYAPFPGIHPTEIQELIAQNKLNF